MTQAYVQDFGVRSGTTTAHGPEWLDELRRTAIERFALTGFPTSRDEEWRFTPIAPIAKGAWRRSTGSVHEVTRGDLAPFMFGHADWTTLVFIDGGYSAVLSSAPDRDQGVYIGSLFDAVKSDSPLLQRHLARHAPIDGSPFTALSTAFMSDGSFVHVPRNVELARPIHLMFVTTSKAAGAVTHTRNLLVIDPGARASVIESYVTLAEGGSYWTNAVTEVVAGANSWVEHTRIQRESERAYHVGLTHVEQERDSHYRSFSLAMGGAMARHNLTARLNGENVETLMYGLYLTRGQQVVDNHTAIHHDQPNCRSWEVYKGVLDGQSRAVFNGKVFVKPEAQKTDAKQTNRNLLLSDEAKVDTKPQLEIFADDVKCTHGATVGRLDDIALFYARSRGVPAAVARLLLTYAFAAEVTSEVVLQPVREELERLVRERLVVL